MKKILVIESSPNRQESGSRAISSKVQARLKQANPDAVFTYRDLAKENLPHLSEAALQSFSIPPEKRTAAQKQAAALSEELTDEFLAADLLVLAVPLWNFGVPSSVKAWIDHVVRAGRTFAYGATGPVGLAKNKKAILVTAMGGVYSEGPMQPMDFVVPYLQSVLGFVGVTDVQVVRLEGTKIPQMLPAAIQKAEAAVNALKL